jgi:hypothetical protein
VAILKTHKEMQNYGISKLVIIYDINIDSYFIESRHLECTQLGIHNVQATILKHVRENHVLKRHGEVSIFKSFKMALNAVKKIDKYVPVEIEEGQLHVS